MTEKVGAKKPVFLFPEIEKEISPKGINSELFQYNDVFFVSATDQINIGLLITFISTVSFLTLSHYVFISQGDVLNLFLLLAFVIASLTVTLTLSALLALNKRALQNAF